MNVELFKNLLSSNKVTGDVVPLNISQERHWHGMQSQKMPESTSVNFSDALNSAFLKVNDQQVHAEELAQQLVSNPRSVQPHSVMIATEKARMSLMFTKTITDLAVKTYKELVNLR